MENHCKCSELPPDAMVSSVSLFKLIILLNDTSLCKCIYLVIVVRLCSTAGFILRASGLLVSITCGCLCCQRKTSSVILFFQFQKMLRLYTANRRLMFKFTNVHWESKQRQTTAWMIVTIPPSWWWILVLRTQNFENCIMCRGSVDLLKGHCTNTPTILAYTI